VGAVREPAVLAVRVVAGVAAERGRRVGAARGGRKDAVGEVAEVGGDHVVAVTLSGVPVRSRDPADRDVHRLFQPREVAARGHLTGEVKSYGFTFAVETW